MYVVHEESNPVFSESSVSLESSASLESSVSLSSLFWFWLTQCPPQLLLLVHLQSYLEMSLS